MTTNRLRRQLEQLKAKHPVRCPECTKKPISIRWVMREEEMDAPPEPCGACGTVPTVIKWGRRG